MQTEKQEAPLIGIKAIADYIDRSERTARTLIKAGQLPARKVGGMWEASPSRLRQWRSGK